MSNDRPKPTHPGKPKPEQPPRPNPPTKPKQPKKNAEVDLDAYVKRLVDEAPPLSAEQRTTIRRILGRPTTAEPIARHTAAA